VLALAALAVLALLLSSLPLASVLLVPVLAAPAWRGTGAHAGRVLRFGADGTLRIAQGTDCGPARLLAVEERGPLLVLVVVAEPAGVLRLGFGPDTAPPAARRALRLWMQRHGGAGDGLLAPLGLS